MSLSSCLYLGKCPCLGHVYFAIVHSFMCTCADHLLNYSKEGIGSEGFTLCLSAQFCPKDHYSTGLRGSFVRSKISCIPLATFYFLPTLHVDLFYQISLKCTRGNRTSFPSAFCCRIYPLHLWELAASEEARPQGQQTEGWVYVQASCFQL